MPVLLRVRPVRRVRRWWVPSAAPTVQYARPSADVEDGSWTNESGNNTDLYASIDESTASDSDYIQSAVNPSSDATTLSLSSVGNPTVDTGHTVRYRIYRG